MTGSPDRLPLGCHPLAAPRRQGRPGRLPFLALLLPALLLAACAGEKREKAIGEAYVGASNAPLRDRLGPAPGISATLKGGDRVEILQKRRRWARVRSASGAEGWLEERHLVARETYESAQELARSAAHRPSQGAARARALANLHLEPARLSLAPFQLQEGEACEVLDHRAVERPLPPGPRPPQPAGYAAGAAAATGTATALAGAQPATVPQQAAAPPATVPQQAAAPPASTPLPPAHRPKPAKGSKGARSKPVGPPREDWFLVRSKGKAGWALARFIEMAIPDEVAQHAEGRWITAWQVLNEVPDRGQKKAQYVWATSGEVGSLYDFDGIRVFTWNPARRRYETSYRQSNLRGLYPLTVGRAQLKAGEFPSFLVTTLDAAGNRVTREFLLIGNAVRRREQVR